MKEPEIVFRYSTYTWEHVFEDNFKRQLSSI